MNLADPSILRAFLSRHGLWASKGLGQHFLISQKVVSAIVGSLSSCHGVLEIGPGPGVLTSPISEAIEKVIAIELDERMILALAESSPQAEIIRADALKEDLSAILERLPAPRGVVSNLPYYITGPLLTRIAESRGHYSKAVLMMQKEVAERVLAGPKTSARGSLSVFLQLQFETRLLVRAPAGAFLPAPKVDSAVLEFVPKELGVPNEVSDKLFRLIRVGFVQPRKTLVNNLIAGSKLDRETAIQHLAAIGLTEKARPQELSNSQWIELHNELKLTPIEASKSESP